MAGAPNPAEAVSGVAEASVTAAHRWGMDDLEKALPVEVASLAARSGNELVFPLSLAIAAVRIATENLIAVLGVEVFHVMETGLHSEIYSGYEFKLDQEWRGYVRLNNDAALGS
jgi:hypothetical protein